MSKLIQFTVGNYRSFNEKRTFTLRTDRKAGRAGKGTVLFGGERLSNLSAFYGANSGGKSNFVNAMATMRMILRESVRINDGEPIAYEPFALLEGRQMAPQSFEAVFIDDDFRQVRYGFSNTLGAIATEWLFVKAPGERKEHPLFLRNGEGVAVDGKRFAEGSGLEDKINDNRLFLSLAAQLGGEVSKGVMKFFIADFNIISGLDNGGYEGFTQLEFETNSETSARAMDFFRRIELGFDNIEIHKEPLSPEILSRMPEELRKRMPKEELKTYSVHQLLDTDGIAAGSRAFPFEDFESAGTQKIFSISGPVFDTLKRGAVLIVDELDSKLHPLLSQELVRLFAEPESNPCGAQLIFTTHDSNLLSTELLRRDQVWFAEKDRLQATDIYRLTDITLPDGTPMPDAQDYEYNYIQGRYGAIPFIRN